MAMNAYRNYNTNTSALSKNLEKLSSGYKINRAGDDAAGLAISEKMRAQITGLEAAQKNVKDGISLVKTGEGAMQEIQDMLNRMDYLATQSANGTYQDEVDRENLQKEVNALRTEINRIADSANFNGIKLLDGSLAGGGGSASLSDVEITPIADATPAGAKAQKGIYVVDLSNYKASSGSAANSEIKIQIAGKTLASATADKTGAFVTGADFTAADDEVEINGTTFAVEVKDSKITLTMKDLPTAKFEEDMTVTVDGVEKTSTEGSGGNHAATPSVIVKQDAIVEGARTYAQGSFELQQGDIVDGYQLQIGKQTYTFAVGKNSKFKGGSNVVDLTDMEEGATDIEKVAARRLSEAAQGNKMFKVSVKNDDGTVHLTEKENSGIDYTVNDLVGAEKTVYNDHEASAWAGLVKSGVASSGGSSGGLTLQIGDTADSFNQLSVAIGDMHAGAMGIASVDISTQSGAQSAIQTIKDAINYVSSVRGDLGAVQNRLEHTGNNLSVMAENIQDAESTIRDTDVASEMMSYVKNNILVQSAQAMLAQANQVPQGVLQLLG